MELPKCNKTEWVHLLFRGDGSGSFDKIDEYETAFKNKNLTAFTIPVLRFDYKNIEQLGQLLKSAIISDRQDTACGLIITSPRVVEALSRAMQLFCDKERQLIRDSLKDDYIFVIGEKSARDCKSKLGINCNEWAWKSGNSRALVDYVREYIKKSSDCRALNLVYPKGSLTDNLIEETLTIPEVQIEPIVVYETNVIENLATKVTETLQKSFRLSLNEPTKFVINMIFFSPSGVDGFFKIDRPGFEDQLRCLFSNREVVLKYSSIGKTTEESILRNSMEVFCVSEKPNPQCLVDGILNAVSSEVDEQ